MSYRAWQFYQWCTGSFPYPEWMFYLWAACVVAFAFVAVALIREKLWRAWPSLTAASILEVCAFLAVMHRSYHSFFYIWWVHAGVQTVLRITALGDVLRALPGGSLMSNWLKAAIAVGAIAASLTVARAMLQHLPDQLHTLLGRVDDAAQFSWAALTVVLLYGVMFSGFRFTMTGMRIATAYICRILAGMVAAVIYNSSLNSGLAFRLQTGLSTAASLIFALYCLYAVLLDRQSLHLTSAETLAQIEKAGHS